MPSIMCLIIPGVWCPGSCEDTWLIPAVELTRPVSGCPLSGHPVALRRESEEKMMKGLVGVLRHAVPVRLDSLYGHVRILW